MPLYDFTCRDCEQSFEKLIRRDAELASLACPKCAGGRVEKQLSLPAAPITTALSTAPSGCGVGPPCGAPRCGRRG